MPNLSALPQALSFVNDLLGNRDIQYRRASWLKNDFNSEVWDCYFADQYHTTIDFRIAFPDGTKLTEGKHAVLLDTIKCFFCIQEHPDTTGGMKLGTRSVYAKVRMVIKLIDYLLLNAEHYRFHQHGFTLLTESELASILLSIGSHPESSETVYRWSYQLSLFLKMQIAMTDSSRLDAALLAFSALQENGVPQDEWVLDLTADEIIRARAWLYLHRFYHPYDSKKQYAFQKVPNHSKLAALIYANTLGGKNTHLPQLAELGIEPIVYTKREYPIVPIRSHSDERHMSEDTFSGYYSVLRHLILLEKIGLPVPARTLKSLKQPTLVDLLKLKPSGRFRTLPSHVVFSSLRRAIEFSLTYGEALVESYLAFAKAAQAQGISLKQWQRMQMDITPYLTPTIRHLGVKHWLLQEPEGNFLIGIDHAVYFSCLRANEGLWELLRVLYGAIQLIVGTLMARRQEELMCLMPTKCLDKERRHLIFYVGKSGYDDKRERIARPIPTIAVKLIQLLERLQAELKQAGIIEAYHPLFSYPNPYKKGLVGRSNMLFNQSLNFFCDYIETPLNKEGQRYYIRQHQLRRFFAMLFFWGSSFGGLDTLRWFLAHTDVEHLYHYITETTPGSVLRGAQAHYATEQLQSYDQNAKELADLLEQRFGTRKFDLMETDELDAYIEDLIEEGSVMIEPEFFKDAEGENYRILIQVKEKKMTINNRENSTCRT